MKPKNTTTNKIKISAFILLGLIIISSATILFLTSGKTKPQAFFARSMNDASYDCEDKIRGKYNSRLVNSYFDNLSSRYEAKKRQYLVYYRISVREDDEGIPTINDYMAKCIVWEKLGYVSDFSVFKP